jgi:hypothetical protein
MDDDTAGCEARDPGGNRRRRAGRVLARAARLLLGPLVVTGAVFGLVFASAGSDQGSTSLGDAQLGDAQLVDYHEECDQEGCSREEVKELWSSFQSECIDEECWMEEVAELAGGAVSQDSSGNWVYTRSGAVAEMMDYFVDRLGHTRAAFVRVRPGQTDRAWEQLVDLILDSGPEVPILTCRLSDGRVYDCHAGD